jgi:hypothetical protein
LRSIPHAAQDFLGTAWMYPGRDERFVAAGSRTSILLLASPHARRPEGFDAFDLTIKRLTRVLAQHGGDVDIELATHLAQERRLADSYE